VALLLSPATAGLLAAAGLLVDFYILVRTPYTVGDRIQIGDATGDAIDVMPSSGIWFIPRKQALSKTGL